MCAGLLATIGCSSHGRAPNNLDAGNDSATCGRDAGGALPNGSTCGCNSACASGFCVDGICCNTACTETCKSCSTTAAPGTCVFVAAGDAPAAPALEPPSRETREALWRHAGLVRDGDGLTTLAGDPHPLARLIARHALLRTESRGAHTRTDFPETDPALDLHHSVTHGGADEPAFERWV